MTKEIFSKGLAILMSCVKDFPLDSQKTEVWYMLLKNIPDEVYLNAIKNIAQSTKDIYPGTNIVAMIREQTQPNIEAEAALAYAKVERAFKKAGIYSSVCFDDPVIHGVMFVMGGDKAWIDYCDLEAEEVKWWRKDFERLYPQLHAKIYSGELRPPKSFSGLWEIDPHASVESKQPMMIGEDEKHKQLWGTIQKYLLPRFVVEGK